MKKILLFITALLICNYSFAMGGDSGGGSNNSLYEDAVDFIKRAGKQEKKIIQKKRKNFIPRLLKN